MQLKLEFANGLTQRYTKCIYLVESKEMTFAELLKKIVKEFQMDEAIRLEIDGFMLLPWQRIDLLDKNDVIQ
jgi:hypothetical protein